MDAKEYCKTIVYNGHMVNIGVDDAGQQFILEYIDDEGNLAEFCCGAYASFKYGLQHLFGPPRTVSNSN